MNHPILSSGDPPPIPISFGLAMKISRRTPFELRREIQEIGSGPLTLIRGPRGQRRLLLDEVLDLPIDGRTDQ
jgi:hypothetical protein